MMFERSQQENFSETSSDATKPKNPRESSLLNLLDSSHTKGASPAGDESNQGPY